MPAPAYLIRTGEAYVAAAHPGPHPGHGQNDTAAQITERNREYIQLIGYHTVHTKFCEEIRAQIIGAVDIKYFAILSTGDFGLADVTARDLLTHLETHYGTITPEAIESNRNLLAAVMNIDDPLEDLWLRITNCQEFATAALEPITDATAIRLTMAVFDQTGVYDHACLTWRGKDPVEHTMANFKTHFNAANLERRRRLTAGAAGFHGANFAAAVQQPPQAAANAAIQGNAAPREPLVVIDGDVFMSYCWSHGLISNCNHTSANCERRSPGHIAHATIRNMHNGCCTIFAGARNGAPTNAGR